MQPEASTDVLQLKEAAEEPANNTQFVGRISEA
jgi:hypothetical protein